MSTASTVEREMLALINQERTSRGLTPLQLETQLNESSEDHSVWMLDTDRFSHTGSGGSSATQRMQQAGFDLEGSWRTGENIAWQSERGDPGISDDVAQLHQNLMNSPGHRANILNPDFKYIGIGVETGDMQGYDAVMVTQNFAATDAQVLLDNGDTTPPPNPTPPVDEVAEPEEPEAETPDTDVTDGEDPDAETPDTDVTDTDVPDQETPDTDVTDTDDPDIEVPDTDVTDTDDPDVETPDTDVTETDTPEDETPDTDVTEPDTPDTDVVDAEDPVDGCFDVAAFLAEIEAFFNTLQARLDEFDWNTAEPEDAVTDMEDYDVTTGNDDDPMEAPAEPGVDMADVDECGFFTVNYFDMTCMADFG